MDRPCLQCGDLTPKCYIAMGDTYMSGRMKVHLCVKCFPHNVTGFMIWDMTEYLIKLFYSSRRELLELYLGLKTDITV